MVLVEIATLMDVPLPLFGENVGADAEPAELLTVKVVEPERP